MFRSILFRPPVLKLAATLFVAAQLLGVIAPARASEPAGMAAPPAAPPQPKPHAAERAALREFDRFLDHHPLLEDQLRLDPSQSARPAFLEKYPELRDFLSVNPGIGEGLMLYPHYYLNRALMRQASAPLSFKELAPFKDLFQQQPELEHELTVYPALIRDPLFQQSHPVLRDCLLQHPALARVFLPPGSPTST